MTKLALIDLDNTMADYHSAITLGLVSLSAGVERDILVQSETISEMAPLWIQERERLVRSAPGFYRNLKPLPLGFFVKEVLSDLGYALHVATKAPRHNTAIACMEKVLWCEEYLPGIPVTLSGDKSILMADILVDDWPGYIGPWLYSNPRGLVIMPSWHWNENYSDERILRVTNTTSRKTSRKDLADFISDHESKYCR